MNFLLEYGLLEEDIELIKKNNSETVLKNIEMNKDNVKKVIDYLLELGITKETLKELFIHQIGMFHRTKKELEQVFDEYEIDSIVKSLNYDVNTVDMIEF
jgi:DNA-directed RNA polymerase specialized sigma54-like protein